MIDLMAAHPWLTFFLGITSLHTVRVLVRGWPYGELSYRVEQLERRIDYERDQDAS